ncbi:MAG: 4-(cytidine 5'-diphospho)-2-C-methyl-D-erythritol kinase [Marinilabiliales bacterium]
MICFPNAKINIGLNVTGKRTDGYHNIKSVFYPVPLCDALEIVESGKFDFEQSGIELDCNPEQNIVVKAFNLFQKEYKIPDVKIFLHKAIPFGAGLGGGSSDAAFLLKMLNDFFNLKLNNDKLVDMASRLGSDCAFFIENKPAFASQRGDSFEFIDLDLKGYYIKIIFPGFSINTTEAYKNIKPSKTSFSKDTLLRLSIKEWKDHIKNDFEDYAFKKYPELQIIKTTLYGEGAVYVSMTGSGSAIYGLFKDKPTPENNYDFVYVTKLE